MPFCSADEQNSRRDEIEEQPDEETNEIPSHCPEGSVTIHIAVTIDDGPRGAITENFDTFLTSEGIKPTWYIVKTNLEAAGSDYIATLQDRVARGHEIAIHEALPSAAVSSDVFPDPKPPSNRPLDLTEHVTPLPSHKENYYRRIGDWAQHIAAFKTELEEANIPIKFYRPPGGLMTELTDMMTHYSNSGDPRRVRDWINTSYRNGNEVSEATRRAALYRIIEPDEVEIYNTLNTFVTTIQDQGLLLWGGEKILGSGQRNAPNERSIVLDQWDGQSWISEIANSRNDAVSDLEGRFQRRRSNGTVNEAKAPYAVILTHDNSSYPPEENGEHDGRPSYLTLLKNAVWALKTDPDVVNGNICLNFVTMSELRSLVSTDPMNQ